MNGKTLSLWAKIIATLFVVGAFFFTPKPAMEIIQIGAFIALVTSPIDVSIWIEKFTGKKDQGGQ